MSFDINKKLSEMFQAYRDQNPSNASNLLQEFTSHFIIASQLEILEVFSQESLSLIFNFLGESPSFIALNLLSFIQLFTEHMNSLSIFINENFEIYIQGVQFIETQELLQFYQFSISHLNPNKKTLESIIQKMFDLTLLANSQSFSKQLGDLIGSILILVARTDSIIIFLERFIVFFQKWTINYLFGFSELVPRVLRVCISNDSLMIMQVQNLVIQQFQQILSYCSDPICSSYENYKIHYYLHNLLEYSYIDQNISFFNQLDEINFFYSIFKKAQTSDSHSISFSRNMGHFYIQIKQRLPFTQSLLDDGSNQARQIMFSQQAISVISKVQKRTAEKDFLTYAQYNGLIPIKLRTPYISLIISLLKEFYVDLLSQKWRYGELFQKTQGNRKLKIFSVDQLLYESVEEFLRFFLIPSKAAVKMFKSQQFLHEQFQSDYFTTIVSQNMYDNEMSDLFIEDAWTGVQEIGVRPLHQMKKKRRKSQVDLEGIGLRSQRLDGEIQLPIQQFNFDIAQLPKGQMLQKFGKTSKGTKAIKLSVNIDKNTTEINKLRKQSDLRNQNKLSLKIGLSLQKSVLSSEESSILSAPKQIKQLNKKLYLKINNTNSISDNYNVEQSSDSDNSQIEYQGIKNQQLSKFSSNSSLLDDLNWSQNMDFNYKLTNKLSLNINSNNCQQLLSQSSQGHINCIYENRVLYKNSKPQCVINQEQSESADIPIQISQKIEKQSSFIEDATKENFDQFSLSNDDISNAIIASSDDFSLDIDFQNLYQQTEPNLNIQSDFNFVKPNIDISQVNDIIDCDTDTSLKNVSSLSLNMSSQAMPGSNQQLSSRLLNKNSSSSSDLDDDNRLSLNIKQSKNINSTQKLDIFQIKQENAETIKSSSSSNKRLKYKDDDFQLNGSDS
ncbi:hypothetical protein SS50377_22204 [Spironucleus salmonicida]|uniref:Uncharacterized protein n=1 Tax=Spironucleus salmonicida TaxID=348837 RepID=V6LLP6_9EUKA|nr:hypothetical protein SS50377_22204 [Spironucleus salmonicida]|eukprot:EST45635.1 hypothetical protein SS50377_14206 [Spironucleus salmonicida]